MKELPVCIACNIPMGKAGFAASGSNKIQRYRCSKCGKTTTKIDGNTNPNNHHNRVLINFSDLEYAQIKVRSLKAELNIEAYLKSLAFREH